MGINQSDVIGSVSRLKNLNEKCSWDGANIK